MKLSEYTHTELDFLKIVCNFTQDEIRLLDLRSKGVSQEDCTESLNMSIATIKRLEQKVQKKIQREI